MRKISCGLASLVLMMIGSLATASAETTVQVVFISAKCVPNVCYGTNTLAATPYGSQRSPYSTLSVMDDSDKQAIATQLNRITGSVAAQLSQQNNDYVTFKTQLLGALNGAVDTEYNSDANTHDAALATLIAKKLANDPTFIAKIAQAVKNPPPPR